MQDILLKKQIVTKYISEKGNGLERVIHLYLLDISSITL